MTHTAMTSRSRRRQLKLRPCLEWFAQQMEHVLRQNDYKGGWDDMAFEDLMERLREETEELEGCGLHTCKAVKEAVDVANFAMMIAEQCRPVAKQGGTP